jgi:hypothetical protein
METLWAFLGLNPHLDVSYVSERFKGWKFGNEVEMMLGDERIHPSIHPSALSSSS